MPQDKVPVTYEALEAYVIGTAVFDARSSEENLVSWRAASGALPADRFPNLVSVASLLYRDLDAAFCYGLDLMLDAIEAGLARGEPGDGPAGLSGNRRPHRDVGVRAKLHQLLHRPEGPSRRGRVHHR